MGHRSLERTHRISVSQGFPGGPTQLPYSALSTPVNDALGTDITGGPAYIPKNNLGLAGLPAGPSQAPYPVPRTLANDALVRSNAWAAYDASVHPNTGLQALRHRLQRRIQTGWLRAKIF